MARTVLSVQRDFALSSGLRSEIIWDSLAANEADVLKTKIQALLPDNGKSTTQIEKARRNLFNSIWQQRKYTNGTLLSAIIYVLVTDERKAVAAEVAALPENEAPVALTATTYSVHPVFRTRKCMNDFNSTAGCCMIFIDEHGRVYQNWRQFVRENVLPKGNMIAPLNGVYTFNELDEVELEWHLTPASRPKAKILNAADRLAGVGGFVATLPIVAAIALPVAGPVLATATVVTLSTAAYTTARSALQLVDRRQHGQPTSLTDRDSRGNWLNVASGVVGIGAVGATRALTTAAAAGREITMGTKLAVNGMNTASLVLSGGGVFNEAYDIYVRIHDDAEIDMVNMLQLASSLIVFTHSINNFRLLYKVGKADRRASTMRRELSTQMRNVYDRLFRETSNSRAIGGSGGNGDVNGQIDLIRIVNDIPVKTVLMNLHQINNHLNAVVATSASAAAGASGMSDLVAQVPRFLDPNGVGLNTLQLTHELGVKFVECILNPSSMKDVLRALMHYFEPRVCRFLMSLARTFLEESANRFNNALNTFISSESVLHKLLMYCVWNYSDFSYKFLESKTGELLNELETYFNSLKPHNAANKQLTCDVCRGSYYICAPSSL